MNDALQYLEQVLGLNQFEAFVMRALAEGEIEDGVRDRFYRLYEKGLGFFSILSMMAAYEQEESEGFSRQYQSFLKGGALAEWILEPPGKKGYDLRETLHLSERIKAMILGGQWELPEAEEPGEWFWPLEENEKPPVTLFREQQYELWSRPFKAGQIKLVILTGPAGIGKKSQVQRLGRETGRPVFFADARQLACQWEKEGEDPVRTLLLECRIKQAVLCLNHMKQEEWEGENKFLFSRFCRLAQQHLPGLICLGEEKLPVFTGLDSIETCHVELPMPAMEESAALWREIGKGYPVEPRLNLEELAGIMVMTPGQIKEVLDQAFEAACQQKEEGDIQISADLLKAACRAKISHLSDRKTVRVPLKYQFSDLILPEAQLKQLKEACSQVKNRYLVYEKWGFSRKQAYGSGISMVFSGSPGTGKTMAAQILAGELGLELYKVDLSAVVSKYIGETEKNLNQIFQEGRKSQSVLFFDEADVLFSKRTEVKDSHDKYSNMEAAFMLQKMEEYTGVVILATNYMQNIDEAFKRRLTFVIEFPAPDLENRRKLWQSVIPDSLPLKKDLDFEFLAEHFEMTGSQIKNSMINGAFLAADRGAGQVGMKEVLEAVVRELAKSGRKLSNLDLGEYASFLTEEGGCHGA